MSTLPSIKALQAFIAVAQYGGIRAAASELCLTQSAVSHQIKQLEETLGVALFVKKGRNLVLNDSGLDYLQHIKSIVHQLEQATTQTSRYQKQPPLTIAAPPSFISNWLLPNLKAFEALHPAIPIRIVQQLTLDRSNNPIDIAIEYRFQAQPGANSQQLFTDELSVFTSPDYAKGHTLQKPEDLKAVKLIETERRLVSWLDVLWDQPWVKSHPFLTVPYSLQALEAARLGYGVALGNKINAQSMLDEGQLIIPFTLSPERKPEVPKYFVTILEGKQHNQTVKLFVQWLREH